MAEHLTSTVLSALSGQLCSSEKGLLLPLGNPEAVQFLSEVLPMLLSHRLAFSSGFTGAQCLHESATPSPSSSCTALETQNSPTSTSKVSSQGDDYGFKHWCFSVCVYLPGPSRSQQIPSRQLIFLMIVLDEFRVQPSLTVDDVERENVIYMSGSRE